MKEAMPGPLAVCLELKMAIGRTGWRAGKRRRMKRKPRRKRLLQKHRPRPPVEEQIIDEREVVIIMRLIVLGLFFHYRITNPVYSAFGLWTTSDICEIWFAFSWILDQFPKWCPINRETYVDRLIAWFTFTYYLMKYISSISRILFFLRHS